MTDALDTLRQALGAYHDPYLGQTLLEARAVRGLEQRGGRLHVALELGIPVGDYGAELGAALEAHLASAGVAHEPLELRLSGTIVAHGRSVKIGSQLGFAEADVTDPGGRLLAKAHSTLSVTRERQQS